MSGAYFNHSLTRIRLLTIQMNILFQENNMMDISKWEIQSNLSLFLSLSIEDVRGALTSSLLWSVLTYLFDDELCLFMIINGKKKNDTCLPTVIRRIFSSMTKENNSLVCHYHHVLLIFLYCIFIWQKEINEKALARFVLCESLLKFQRNSSTLIRFHSSLFRGRWILSRE